MHFHQQEPQHIAHLADCSSGSFAPHTCCSKCSLPPELFSISSVRAVLRVVVTEMGQKREGLGKVSFVGKIKNAGGKLYYL